MNLQTLTVTLTTDRQKQGNEKWEKTAAKIRNADRIIK